MSPINSSSLGREHMIQAIGTAVHDLFSTMLSLPVERGEPFSDAGHPMSFDGVVGLVGIAGAWTGTGRISCSPKFACTLAGALLATEFHSVDEEVLDAVAELANMVIGNVKTHLEERLGPLGLSIPTVIYGRNYQTRSSGVRDWIVVPFHCVGEALEVRFCLMPSSSAQNAAAPDLYHSFA